MHKNFANRLGYCLRVSLFLFSAQLVLADKSEGPESLEVDPSQVSNQEPADLAQLEYSLSSSDAEAPPADDQLSQEFDRLFKIPDSADVQAEIWNYVSDAEQQLRDHVRRILSEKNYSLDSAEFKELIDSDRIEIKTDKAIAGLTRINKAICIRLTHIPTEDAVLIGPREILNTQLPRNSHFQKYVSNIFTFSGRSTGYKVRSRNIHLVRIASTGDAPLVTSEYLEKPKKWISGAWYSHYLNAAFSKPTSGTRNAAVLSTLLEMGVLFGLNHLALNYVPDATPVTLAAGIFAGGFSLGYGMIANGIRKINQFGKQMWMVGVKAGGWTLAYSIPFAYFSGVDDAFISVIGMSFIVNKTADVHWSHITRIDDKLRTMPGEYRTPEKTLLDVDKSLGNVLTMKLKLKTPELSFGSRVNLKSMFIRMPRFGMKALSIIEPTVGIPMLLISIPIMSVLAHNYAVKLYEAGRVNEKDVLALLNGELNNIWVRSWDALLIATKFKKTDEPIHSWSFLKAFVSEEYFTMTWKIHAGIESLDRKFQDLISNLSRTTRRGASNVVQRSVSILVSAVDFTKAELSLMAKSIELGIDMGMSNLSETLDTLSEKIGYYADKLSYDVTGAVSYILVESVLLRAELKPIPVRVVDFAFHGTPFPSNCRKFLSQ